MELDKLQQHHYANTLCRTCLKVLSDDALDITKHDIFLTTDVVKKLVLCTSLTVEQQDGYPKHLCDCCYAKVNEFHQFQTMCVESAQRFKDVLQYRVGQLDFEDEKPLCDFETTKLEMCNETNLIPINVDDPMLLDEFEKEAFRNTKGSEMQVHRKSRRNMISIEKVTKAGIKSKNRGGKNKGTRAVEKLGVELEHECAKDLDNDFNEGAENETRRENCVYLDENPQPKFNNTITKNLRKTTSKGKPANSIRHYCTEPGCDRSYTQKQSVNQHLRLHHNIGPEIQSHICEICGKSFKFSRNLNDHRYTHRDKSELPYPCELAPGCLRRFAKKDKLKDHMMRHAGIKNYVCPICGLRKVTGNELKSHMNYHTLERTWPCHLCAYVSKNAGNLKVHMRTIHGMTDNGEKPYACVECGKSFNHPAALGSHEKIHRRQASKVLHEDDGALNAAVV